MKFLRNKRKESDVIIDKKVEELTSNAIPENKVLNNMISKFENADTAIRSGENALANKETASFAPAIQYIKNEDGVGPEMVHFYQINSTGIDMQDPTAIAMQRSYNSSVDLIRNIVKTKTVLGYNSVNSLSDEYLIKNAYQTAFSQTIESFKTRIYSGIESLLLRAACDIKHNMIQMVKECPYKEISESLDIEHIILGYTSDINTYNSDIRPFSRKYWSTEIMGIISFIHDNALMQEGDVSFSKENMLIQASCLAENTVSDIIREFTSAIKANLSAWVISHDDGHFNYPQIIDDLMSSSYDIIDKLFDSILSYIMICAKEYAVLGLNDINKSIASYSEDYDTAF